MATIALLLKKSHPTDADIDAIENVCRCGTYPRIRKAVKEAADRWAVRDRVIGSSAPRH